VQLDHNVFQTFTETKTKNEKGQPLTGVWQNGGFSAKFKFSPSIELLCKNGAFALRNPPERKARKRYGQNKISE
jgi:hypothetical protein